MRNMILIFTLFSLLGCDSNRNKSSMVTESDFNQAKLAFTELEEALKNDNGKLWNHKLNGPILLVNRDSRIIIANEKDKNDELQKHKSLYIGRFPENMNIGNGITEWNGKLWVIVGLPLPELKEERMRLLIHELFHRIQPEIGFDSLLTFENVHLDTKEGRILLKLEMEALKQALQSNEPQVHIKNAFMFRNYRHQIFPGSLNSENSLEIREGIAEYTGTILCGMIDADLQQRYFSQIDRLYSMPTFVRSFAYFTIPVYGYFMKQMDPDWNLVITNKTDLSALISKHLNISNQKLESDDIAKIGRSYYIDSIKRFEEERELMQLVQSKKYKAQFLSDSVLSIMLENIDIAFNAKAAMPLDTFGIVYPNLRITDKWGILEVDSCGALVSSDWKFVTISYPEMITDTLITGRGWKLKLYNQWSLKKEAKKYIITNK